MCKVERSQLHIEKEATRTVDDAKEGDALTEDELQLEIPTLCLKNGREGCKD